MADIKVTFPGGKKVDSEIRGFTISTDQPEAAGGDNSAPTPFELFLASLASCTGITILSFCKNKEINTEGLSIEANVEKDDSGNVIKMITEVTVPKDFPEKYIGSIERIAGTCKVKRHIENAPEFEIVVKS